MIQSEILARQSSYEALRVQGSGLVSRGSEDTQAVQAQQLMDKMDGQWTLVLNAWQQRLDLLNKCKNYLVSVTCM